MIEKAIEENTAALLEVAASNRELAAAILQGQFANPAASNEKKVSKSSETEKSQEKISEEETPTETAAEKKKRIAKEKREAKAAEEAAAASAEEEEEETSDASEATEEDCRAIATYIIKEKKDKPALAGVLKANKISMISEFKGGWSKLLGQLEKAAGKTLAEVSS